MVAGVMHGRDDLLSYHEQTEVLIVSCWLAYLSECAKTHHFKSKSRKIFWGGAQTPPLVGRGHPSPHPTPYACGHLPWTLWQ